MLPHDLLPIKRPLEDDTEYSPFYFYNNVVSYLIEDILRMESTGIPVNLSKVRELEDVIINVLKNSDETFSSNKLVQDFLDSLHQFRYGEAMQKVKQKEKTAEDYITTYNPNNKVHRTFVVNEYLKHKNKEDMIQDSWSIKDLRKLNMLLNDNFIDTLLRKEIHLWMADFIHKAMLELAESKAEIYNKNLVTRKQKSEDSKPRIKFNPASTLQKQQFFQYLGIPSTSKTEGGKEQWNRTELEKLYNLVDSIITDKEKEDGATQCS